MSLQDTYFDLRANIVEQWGEDSNQHKLLEDMWDSLCRLEHGYNQTSCELSELKTSLRMIGSYLKVS